jgi:3-oxosteroid 1-dehydrogenase
MAAWDLEYDFVNLGAGIGGVTAAITAHEAGISTVILEKSDQLGGVAAYSGGQLWVPGNHLAEQEGIKDNWEDAVDYIDWLAEGTADRSMLRIFCKTARDALRFLDERAGVRWVSLGLPDNRWPDAPGAIEAGRFIELHPFDGNSLEPRWKPGVRFSPTSWFTNHELYFEFGSHPHRPTWDWERAKEREAADMRLQGSALAGYLLQAVIKRGIPMHTNVEIEELVRENGGVAGVVAKVDGETKRIRGRLGTLIAMGGYDWNAELMERFDEQRTLGSRSPRSVTGDHFALVEPLGVELGSVVRSFGFGYSDRLDADGPERWFPFYSGWPHALLVNEHGERFTDESGGHTREFARRLRESSELRREFHGGHFYAIFDAQYVEKYPVGINMPGSKLPGHLKLAKAETIGDLADAIGVGRERLEQTVKRFNHYATQAIDPDFQRGENVWSHAQFGDPWHAPNPNLATLEKPPFHGVQVRVTGVGITQVGLKTDDCGRVVNADGPINGLYAAGNSMAWLDLGANYHSGSANTRGMTWGYIAALDAAARANGNGKTR